MKRLLNSAVTHIGRPYFLAPFGRVCVVVVMLTWSGTTWAQSDQEVADNLRMIRERHEHNGDGTAVLSGRYQCPVTGGGCAPSTKRGGKTRRRTSGDR